jgi:hypothetical protein
MSARDAVLHDIDQTIPNRFSNADRHAPALLGARAALE